MNNIINKEIDNLVNKLKEDYKQRGYIITEMDEIMLRSGMAYGVPLVSKILASIEFNPFDNVSCITNELPSMEEYLARKYSRGTINTINLNDKYSEPKFKCCKCDGNMRKNLNEGIVLDSNPPQYKYEYKCDKCGDITYLQV